MPVLLWVTFWSMIMGAATCLGDVSQIRAKPPERRD
jgi:hypothetical protein